MNVDFDDLELRDDQSYWHDGKPFEGVAVYRREDGTVESEVSYVDGVQSGPCSDYHPSGKPAFQGIIRNGVYHGECKKWSEMGFLTAIETYEFGICTSKKEFDDTGEVVSESNLSPDDPNYSLLEGYRKQNA